MSDSNVVDGLHPVPPREDRPAVRARLDRDGAGRGLPAARRAVTRLPIRVRLTLGFALAMAVVLAGVGRLRVRARRRTGSSRRSTRRSRASRRTSSSREHIDDRRGRRHDARAGDRCGRERPALRSAETCRRCSTTRRWPRRSAARRVVQSVQIAGRSGSGGCSRCAIPPTGRSSVVARSLEPRAEIARSPPARALHLPPARASRSRRSAATRSPPSLCGPVEAMRERAADRDARRARRASRCPPRATRSRGSP